MSIELLANLLVPEADGYTARQTESSWTIQYRTGWMAHAGTHSTPLRRLCVKSNAPQAHPPKTAQIALGKSVRCILSISSTRSFCVRLSRGIENAALGKTSACISFPKKPDKNRLADQGAASAVPFALLGGSTAGPPAEAHASRGTFQDWSCEARKRGSAHVAGCSSCRIASAVILHPKSSQKKPGARSALAQHLSTTQNGTLSAHRNSFVKRSSSSLSQVRCRKVSLPGSKAPPIVECMHRLKGPRQSKSDVACSSYVIGAALSTCSDSSPRLKGLDELGCVEVLDYSLRLKIQSRRQ